MRSTITPPYEEHATLFKEFLLNFPKDQDDKSKKYRQRMVKIAQKNEKSLYIELDDMEAYFGDLKLVTDVEKNTTRYLNLFSTVVDECMPALEEDWDDVLDILKTQRATRMQLQAPQVRLPNPQKSKAPVEESVLPKELTRRYELRFVPRESESAKPVPLRLVRSQHIGHLVTVKGIVTRVTEVKPLLVVATYNCDKCGYDVFKRVNQRQFLPPTTCPSEQCQKGSGGKLELHIRGSKFVKFQEIRIQELAEHVPIGHIPRTISVQLIGELTRQLSPGDTTTIHGIFLPVPNTGFRVRFAGLIASTYIYGLGIVQSKKKYSEYAPEKDFVKQIEEAQSNPLIYQQLANSIAPEIYGHEDVKKALLLMMVGGVTRVMEDGMKIRGDINICLMGDPGVAKSQLLKHIATIAPRGVYTSGKGSSGVGLTAAVVKDQHTGELILEGGSLVLADMGICCIDEFDKMDETDRTAIHEVMEQQTISIAKAGITTTLNARTSILAAANPLYGRYRVTKSPTENINLPAALLSRFDLMFLLLDRPDPARDRELAEHVAYVHKYNKHPEKKHKAFTPAFMRAYVSLAKKIEPFIPPSLRSFIVDSYINMRHNLEGNTSGSGAGGGSSSGSGGFVGPFGYTTARTLLAILRLSQAMARVRFSREVMQGDVEEALRLMHACQNSLRASEKQSQQQRSTDPITLIYKNITEYAKKNGLIQVRYNDILPRVIGKFTQENLDNTLKEYERLEVWKVDANKTVITFTS